MHVRVSMAMTADGKTADEDGEWFPLCPYERQRIYSHMSPTYLSCPQDLLEGPLGRL
jgi:hypothetical protein